MTELERADVERELEQLWARCTLWEVTRAICDRASVVAPTTGLRTLDALHLATFLEARRRLGPHVELVSADERMIRALGGA